MGWTTEELVKKMAMTHEIKVVGLDLVIQDCGEKFDFDITKLLRFDIIIGKI
mgnify:CR=1 FL=1